MQFAEDEYEYSWWSGQRLTGTADKSLSFDLETELIKPYREPLEGERAIDLPTSPLHIPRPSLGMAYADEGLYLIHPVDFREFISLHRGQHLVGQNLAFDFWVLQRHTDPATCEFLWSMGDKNLLHDTMIMDLLLQLATNKYRYNYGKGDDEDSKLYPANLGILAEEWQVGEVDKTDKYRLRFGELLGLSKVEISNHPEFGGFSRYALGDVLATRAIYIKQRKAGLECMRRAGWSSDPKTQLYEIRPDAVEKFGVLSESIQVNASIVLAELSRTPVNIDIVTRQIREDAARARYNDCLNTLLSVQPELIKRYKRKNNGAVKITARSKLPQFNQKKLVEILLIEAERLGINPPISTGKLKGISTSAKEWGKWEDQSGFISAWCGLEKEAKSLEFLTGLDASEIYSRYNLMMVTGRTSAGAHKYKTKPLLPGLNIQQIPRDDKDNPDKSIRCLFVPPDGHLWAAIDYGFIELCALAAICRARFGWSVLGDTIEQFRKGIGLDPHQKMAVELAGCTESEYLQLPIARQKELRQQGKSIGFGFPGGLGVDKFIQYAKISYKVDFTKEQAKAAKQMWLNLYKEMRLYLADSTEKALARSAGSKRILKLDFLTKKRLSDYLRGTTTPTGMEAEKIWELLEWAANEEEVIQDVEQRNVTRRVRELTFYRACTLTGRVRDKCKYTVTRNLPFQGIAADGAKIALWRCMRNGYKLIAFVHDELDIAVNPARAKHEVAAVEKIMVDSMQYVLGQNVPVACESSISTRWSK